MLELPGLTRGVENLVDHCWIGLMAFDALGSELTGLDGSNAQTLVEKIRRAPESAVVKVMLHFATLFDTMVASGQKMFLTSQMHVEATLEQNKELESRNLQLEQMNTKLKELDRLK